jgi:hypothetical protein
MTYTKEFWGDLELTKEQKLVMGGLLEVVHARERTQRWRKKNPTKTKEWRAANRDKCRKTDLEWRAKHPELIREYASEWQRNHPEVYRAVRQRRRARKKNSGASFTAQQWLDLKHSYGDRCLGCGRTEKEIIAAGLKLVPDHVKALVNGGTNTIDNLQPLCNGIGGCNNRKGRKFIDYRA